MPEVLSWHDATSWHPTSTGYKHKLAGLGHHETVLRFRTLMCTGTLCAETLHLCSLLPPEMFCSLLMKQSASAWEAAVTKLAKCNETPQKLVSSGHVKRSMRYLAA